MTHMLLTCMVFLKKKRVKMILLPPAAAAASVEGLCQDSMGTVEAPITALCITVRLSASARMWTWYI